MYPYSARKNRLPFSSCLKKVWLFLTRLSGYFLWPTSVTAECSSEANHAIKIFGLRLGCNFLNLCEMLFIYLHSSRIRVGLLQLFAFILTLIISKESFAQSISLGHQIKKPVLSKCRIAAQGSLWEPKLLGRQELKSPSLAVQLKRDLLSCIGLQLPTQKGGD